MYLSKLNMQLLINTQCNVVRLNLTACTYMYAHLYTVDVADKMRLFERQEVIHPYTGMERERGDGEGEKGRVGEWEGRGREWEGEGEWEGEWEGRGREWEGREREGESGKGERGRESGGEGEGERRGTIGGSIKREGERC